MDNETEKRAAYIPFEGILGEASKIVFEALQRKNYQALKIEDPNSWVEDREPKPDFLLTVFGEQHTDVKDIGSGIKPLKGAWISTQDENYTKDVLQQASQNEIPILIINSLLLNPDSDQQLFNVSSVVEPYTRRESTVLVEAKNSEQLSSAILDGLERIEKLQSSSAESPDVSRIESIAGSSVADVATPKDALGFDVYVEALGAYLTHEDTKGPLALSIEGEWGSGKSSFMLQLRKWLKDEQNTKTVWFNAWRHDKEEALWAAFALRFVEEMSAQMKSRLRRSRTKWRLMRNRFDWRSGWFDLVRTIFTMLLWIVIAVAIWVAGREKFMVSGKLVGLTNAVHILLGLVGSVAALRAVFRTVSDTIDIVGNPLRFDLKKHIKELNYAERIGFIEQFHRDFNKIVNVYAGNEKVFVFIDDLDRCEVPKSADMMQAMNLMIGSDDRLIFIVGMDRQKIAAGLAVKYEKLLPYMELNGKDSVEQDKTRVGTRFGYDFIEKFIQLPFRVPAPGSEKIDEFLESLVKEKEKPVLQDQKKLSGLWSKINKLWKIRDRKKESEEQPDILGGEIPPVDIEDTQETQQEEQEIVRRWDEFALEMGDDSDNVQEMVKMVAKTLNYNPRRIKQFINVFRLKAYIAYNTGQFNPPTNLKDVRAVTFEQLAKFAVIELRWPLLLADLEESNDLLKQLSEFAEASQFSEEEKLKKLAKPKTTIESRWRNENELMELLANNANPKGKFERGSYEDFSLIQLDVSKLLQVSAKVTPPEVSESPDSVEETKPETDTSVEERVERTWKQFGDILNPISERLQIDPGSAVAILCVEASENAFEPTNQNRMIIRFENHKFWDYWGKKNEEVFNRHFQFGEQENDKSRVWLNHTWRKSEGEEWQNFHGNQAKEWEVLEFARSLDDTAALFSTGMGAPQIMGYHHQRIGYSIVKEMFEKFSQDIQYQIEGLFNFFDTDMIKALRRQDFINFAGYYNGSSQKEKYGNWIQNHYNVFQRLFSMDTTAE